MITILMIISCVAAGFNVGFTVCRIIKNHYKEEAKHNNPMGCKHW